MSQLDYIQLSREGKILVITINNPPHNALPSRFFRELHSCCDLMLSSDIHAIIFTGKGKNFSKGADIQEIRSGSSTVDLKTILSGNDLLTFISQMKKPVIAAINGACLGGGLELALACHIRLCSEKARLGLPEVSIGVIPGLGGIQRLVRMVGESKALEMLLLGDIISAHQALELNLVNRVFPKDDFLTRVILFTKTILAARREALEAVLDLVALSRPKSEVENIPCAAETFMRLISDRNA
jgi:enoyl-CoA hydratase